MVAAAYQKIPGFSLTGFQQSATTLCFDPVSDTLWTGSAAGIVSAYHGLQGQRGVAFPIGKRLGVRKILASDSSVRAMNASTCGSWSKGGLNKWHNGILGSLTTMALTTPSSVELAVATTKLDLFLVNDATGDIIRSIQTPSIANHMASAPSLLLLGCSDGYIRAHDTRTLHLRTDILTKAHISGVQGLQMSGNLVYTIGLGIRQGRPFPDPLVKVWDLRKLKPMPPIPFSSGPAFINVIPRRAATIAITSNLGLVNIVNANNASESPEFCHLDTSAVLSSVAVSPTGSYIAASDNEGGVHLLSQAPNDVNPLPFNGFDGRPIEWGDTTEPIPAIEWDDETPLNSIGLPHYDSVLASALPTQVTQPTHVFPPPAHIPSSVLATVKYNENIAYAALPRELRGRRNLFVAGIRKQNARFRSGKAKGDDEQETQTFDYASAGVPKAYRKVEIEYSKFGVEDFDFAFYNKTEFSGLETHILHSYTNPVVQVMNYLLPIRILSKSHITTPCSREHCLLCELGFVVRMLEDGRGTNCQASNFCKAVGVLAHATNAIELIDYGRDAAHLNFAHMIQLFNRFLLDHFSSEGNYFPNNPVLLKVSHTSEEDPASRMPAVAPITQLLGIDAKNVVTCLNCQGSREKDNLAHLLDLSYPRQANGGDTAPQTDLAAIIRGSLFKQFHHKATCQTCKRFTNFSARRSISSKDLPPILSLNACVYNEETQAYWLDQRKWTFLRPTVDLFGQVEGKDDPEPATYEVRALVVKVVGKNNHSHLVAIIKVPEAESRSKSESPWFIFNDFAVTNVSEAEALSFPDKWKVPAIVYLQRQDVMTSLDFASLPVEADTSILCRDTSISVNRDPSRIKHEVLGRDELPRPGTIVAIDAEFVSMQQEEIDFRSDGSRKVIRPARLSLARVSVLRGDGPKKGVPLIDDHIHTSEMIVDYLTEFSGIKFGDLDPILSPHTLTPLKVVYKKLRMLVDMGCIFVGHGLSKDFRIINLFVPPEQVLDTVDIFFLPNRQRRLSLKFLCWVVCGELVQSGNHDSIEDARSALKLFTAFHEFESEGTFDHKLDEIYKIGKQLNFKPPVAEDTGNRSDSPSVSETQASNRQNVAAELARNMMAQSFNMGSSRYPSSNSGSPAPTQMSPGIPNQAVWDAGFYRFGS